MPRTPPAAEKRASASPARSFRILGIDPGTVRLGYGVIECRGAGAAPPGSVSYVECGVIAALGARRAFGATGRDRARAARASGRGAPRRGGDGGGVLRRQRAVDAGARRGARGGAVRRRRARARRRRLSARDRQAGGGRPRARDEAADRVSGARAAVAAPHPGARRGRRAGDRHLPCAAARPGRVAPETAARDRVPARRSCWRTTARSPSSTSRASAIRCWSAPPRPLRCPRRRRPDAALRPHPLRQRTSPCVSTASPPRTSGRCFRP